jgi:F0F1-type ATP synthase assembly protein I
LSKNYSDLESKINRKIKIKKQGEKKFDNLKIATSLSWIFITPIVMSIFLGNYIKKFFIGNEVFVMVAFIVLGIIFSCINIIYVIKTLCKGDCRL